MSSAICFNLDQTKMLSSGNWLTISSFEYQFQTYNLKYFCSAILQRKVISNSIPNNKNLDMTKLKAFADDKLNIARIMISLYDGVENTMGKGKMLVTSIFSFYHGVFQNFLLSSCTSNFSFSHNVFRRHLSQTHQKVSLYGNGLR